MALDAIGMRHCSPRATASSLSRAVFSGRTALLRIARCAQPSMLSPAVLKRRSFPHRCTGTMRAAVR
eukprot:2190039-Alexandrium_andersonii.AAC.1